MPTDTKSWVMSREEFDALSPRQKGYVVYMAGNREDQPNVPAEYMPTPEEAADYESGQQAAIIELIDGDAQ